MFFKKPSVAVLLILVLIVGNAIANEEPVPATALIPDNAILVVQVTQPESLIERAFDTDVVEFVQSLPQYKEAMANPESQQVLSLVQFFENKYDAKLPELIRRLVGGGVTLVVAPEDEVVLIVDAEELKYLNNVCAASCDGRSALRPSPLPRVRRGQLAIMQSIENTPRLRMVYKPRPPSANSGTKARHLHSLRTGRRAG